EGVEGAQPRLQPFRLRRLQPLRDLPSPAVAGPPLELETEIGAQPPPPGLPLEPLAHPLAHAFLQVALEVAKGGEVAIVVALADLAGDVARPAPVVHEAVGEAEALPVVVAAELAPRH